MTHMTHYDSQAVGIVGHYPLDLLVIISGLLDKIPIEFAALQFSIKTFGCVQWVKRTTQSDYVHITCDRPGCYAVVGRRGGKQDLNVQRDGCLEIGIIEHEMLHSLGVWHEQSRPDR